MSLRLGLLLPLGAWLALLVACGGGGEERSLIGDGVFPTDTGTSPIFQRSPIAFTPSPSPTAFSSPGGATPAPTQAAALTPAADVGVTPLAEPLQVSVDEAVNVRDRPSTSTETTVLGAIYPGDVATVLGETRGEAVLPGNDLWYEVELTQNGVTLRGFVYAALVKETQ